MIFPRGHRRKRGRPGGYPDPALIWRGDQRCSIILQLGFLLFGKVSPERNSSLTRAAAGWYSFRQSIGFPGASLGQKPDGWHSSGSGITITLPRSKTDRERQGREVYPRQIAIGAEKGSSFFASVSQEWHPSDR